MLSSWQKLCIKGDNSKPPASDPNEQPNYTVNGEKLQNAILLQKTSGDVMGLTFVDAVIIIHHMSSKEQVSFPQTNSLDCLSSESVYTNSILLGISTKSSGGWMDPKKIPCSPMNQGYNNLYTAVKCCLIP